jgi:hypothetical protein
MSNIKIHKLSPILIKKITSALPTNLFNKLTELNDINSSSLSSTNAYLKYDSASQNFTFVSLSSLGGGLDSAAVNALIAAADTHDSAAVIGQIDSAYVQPLARAAIVAGSNITYDSATGTISSTASGTVDSAAVNTLIAAADTHDSAAVLAQINAKFASNATFSRDLNVDSNLTVSGYIGGPAVFTIDPAAIGDSTGKVIILGDLQVDGTQTTINSTTVSISDKNIVLADSATDASQADGAGITVNGASATLQYAATGDKWVFNKSLYVGLYPVLTSQDDTHDSAAVQGQIDSAVNQTLVRSFIDQSFINTFDTHDSAAIVGQIDSAYVRPLARAAFVAGTNITYDSATGVIASTASGGTGTDSAAVVSIADSRIGVASIGALSDVDLTGIATNRVLKWNGTKFVAALDATGSGGAGIALTDLGTTNTAGKFGSLSYNNVSGIFTYTGPDSADVNTVINAKFANDATFSKDLNVDSNLTVSGNLGIGTTSPLHPLHVIGSIYPTTFLQLNSGQQVKFGNGNQYIEGTNDTSLELATGGSTSMIINNSGQVGIGTTSPSKKLHVVGEVQIDSDLTLGGVIKGPSTMTIDKNIILADSAVDSSQANGAGITVNGANATLQYAATGDKWVFNKAPYYSTNRILTTADDLHDSASIQGQIDSAVTIAFINSLSGTLDADTLGGNDSSYYLNYNNFTNKPTIPTVDSATIQPLARAAIVAGTNVSYDSATGVISVAASFDTHDSALIQGQIDSSINNDIIGTSNEVEVNATGGVATIGLPAAVQITTSLTVGGNAVLTTASDTHDSAAVQGQIDSAGASFLSSDSDDTMSANLTVTGTITTGSGNNTTVIKSDTATYNNYSIKHDLDGTSVTLSSATVIDTYTHNSAKTSIEYLIHIEHNTSAETQITKVLATYKGSGTDVQFTEYGEIFTGDSSLGALTVDENAGSIRLLLDPRGSEDVISKVVRTVII